MKRAWLAVALVATACAVAGAAEKRPVAGVIVAIEGKPELKLKGEEKFKRMKLNGFVYEGDSIKTDAGERVAVAMIGGAEVRINENSVFEVESGGGRQTASLKTTLGQAWTRMLHGMAGIKVKTPMAVAAVRGTEADIDLEDPTRLAVKVYEGHVDLLNPESNKTLAKLQAGQMSEVADGSASAPRSMSQSDYGTWQDGLQAKNMEDSLRKLKEEGERTKTLKIIDKDGNTIEIPLKHK